MKYLKTYESIEREPQIGDYVICKESDKRWQPTNEFIDKNMDKF